MPADLEAIARLPIARRGPFLPTVLPLADADDPALRAAALDVLAGCRGVPALRAIVGRLGDDEPAVRATAVDALRSTARDAPHRYVHALFHPRADTRVAAIGGELPHGVRELAMYLRADPACRALAAAVPWPDSALPVAFELHVAGYVSAVELVELVVRTPLSEVRTMLGQELHREPDVVDAYLEQAATTEPCPAPGHDLLDVLVAAIHTAASEALTFPLQRSLDRFVEIVTPHKARAIARRAAVALLSERCRRPVRPDTGALEGALLSITIALEPRAIGFPAFTAEDADPAVFGLVRYRWPVRPTTLQIDRLLQLPLVQADLALAAAVAGMLPGKRLARLAAALGVDAIVNRLVASDRGWDEICLIPNETPPLELRWLAAVEALDYKRYIALSGRAIGMFSAKRRDAFVEQMPRRHREPAFIAAFRTQLDDERLQATCQVIAARVDRAGLVGVFNAILGDPDAGARRRNVLALVRAMYDHQLPGVAAALSDAAAERFVAALDTLTDPPPRDREIAIATAYATRTSPMIRDWCERVASFETAVVFVVERPIVGRALTIDEGSRIASCGPAELPHALKPAYGASTTGLAPQLALRVAAPSVQACTALLGCADPIDDVARQLDRFANSTDAFDARLDDEAVVWLRVAGLPPLANARLYRWEAHTFALAHWLDSIGGVQAALAAAESLPGWLARQTLWRGISEALMFFRYRDRTRFRAAATQQLAEFCAERVDRDIGRHAARVVVALVEGGAVSAASVRDRVLDRIADADAVTREFAARIVRFDGVPEPPPIARELPTVDLIAELRACRDRDTLVRWCHDARPAVVEEAVLALLVLGVPGQVCLAALLAQLHTLVSPLPIVASVILWDHPEAIARASELSQHPALPPAWQFHLCLALAARGDGGALSRAFAATRAVPTDAAAWLFRRDDWQALVRVAGLLPAALALADAHHHHAYQRAIATLLEAELTPDVSAALHRFLELDGDRPLHLRLEAARKLAAAGDLVGMPLLVEQICDESDGDWVAQPPRVLVASVDTVVDAALIGGPAVCAERRMLAVLEAARNAIAREHVAGIYARVFEQSSSGSARHIAAAFVVDEAEGHARLERVAQVFAWGVRRGVELTGRQFRIHMTSKERDLGHTRLSGNRIFVSALPMLRDETHGRDVVEGLVLHEIGHHVYHRSDDARALWARAHKEGVGHLLNLIADEHLERNLRAQDAEYGDRLKRLGSYAFQHAPQELVVATLLCALRGSAARALIATPLEVAFDEASVRLRRGAVLAELDRLGHPLARFARALRMGLGNRANDPQLAAALELCKAIRELDMQQMYELTWKLANMFGGAIACARVFGGPEGLEFGERDGDVFGAGVDDDALQKEVDRILDPKRNKSKGKGPPNKLWVNVNPDEEFERITNIARVRGNPEAHARIARQVDRHATRLRALLDDLGLRWEPMKARTSGRAIDRGRLPALVTRGDPRILIARAPKRRTDLFLGTIVDCSGSMQAGQNIERARRFGVLIAEAVRPLPGVEARFFGFTDSTIYDAGDARDCGVVGLVADGGNNDAAALFHVANQALASPKRAKLVVMISDGLPTECSVAAVRGLVTQLTRRKGIVCAQVAVRELAEVCFPHYVVLDDAKPDVAVARFGRMIGDLARRSLLR